MKNNIILLHGHDYSKKWLEKIEDNKYRLCGDLINHSRFGLSKENDKNYTFVDPPGGPIIYVGDYLNTSSGDKILVKEIFFDNENIIIKTK